jgi:hypothetical protein
LVLTPVTKLGLLYFYPSSINQESIEQLFYRAEIIWIEIAKDEEGFLRFIEEVLDVLELPEAPEHSPKCPWCNYVTTMTNP